MKNGRPNTVSFLRAIKLCVLLLCSPKKFMKLEEEEEASRKSGEQNESIGRREHPTIVVRRAFYTSACLVFASAVLGYTLGRFCFACASSTVPTIWAQIVGTCLLLWGTLFIRGWEIQTHGGVTLTEKVNQWIYRCLCCVGTFILIFSIACPQCQPPPVVANPAVERNAPKAHPFKHLPPMQLNLAVH